MLEKTTQEMFCANLNTRFREARAPLPPLELELVEVTDLGSTADHDQFSLIFAAPADVAARQRVFRLEHETLGAFDLFLVPVGRSGVALKFEAVINRILQRT